MTRAAWGVLMVGIALGTAYDLGLHPPTREVLQADLHVHTLGGDGTLTPPALLLEARARGLDVIAVTNHNQIALAQATQILARATGGPLVLVGEEITAPAWHLVAVGLRETVDWRQPLPAAIAAVHAQGGVAILAHPTAKFWPVVTDDVLRALDGVEAVHPRGLAQPRLGVDMAAFARRARHISSRIALVGSSDDHGLGYLGTVRTHVRATARTEEAVLAALREGRTVPERADRRSADPPLRRVAGLLGWLGLAGVLLAARACPPA